jgi:YrbI family 3-deoxy-D-manno-octulosonate 8-phosphate phosphatase
MKKFNTRDGHGITLLHAAGIKTAFVTRERTSVVTRRAAKLGVTEVHQGALDKLPVVKSILEKHGVTPEEVCYIGDDVGDLEVMGYVGLAVAVADALPQITKAAHYLTRKKGGEGAVREVCELILSSRQAKAEP